MGGPYGNQFQSSYQGAQRLSGASSVPLPSNGSFVAGPLPLQTSVSFVAPQAGSFVAPQVPQPFRFYPEGYQGNQQPPRPQSVPPGGHSSGRPSAMNGVVVPAGRPPAASAPSGVT